MKQIVVKIAGLDFTIDEPVFGVLKKLIPAFNRLQTSAQSDRALFGDIWLILTLLLGPKIKKLNWYQRPKAEEIASLLQILPEFLGLVTDASASLSNRARALSEAKVWDELYCIIIDRTGWTFEQIDNTMTLSRLAAMNDYWQEHPPTNSLVAAYLDYKYEAADGGIEDLIRQLKIANNDE